MFGHSTRWQEIMKVNVLAGITELSIIVRIPHVRHLTNVAYKHQLPRQLVNEAIATTANNTDSIHDILKN